MAIAIDGSTPVVVDLAASTAATATTASFSPPASSLVLAVVNVGLQGTSATNTVSVADSGSLSYTAGPSIWAFSANGVWYFLNYYSSAPGSITLTATRSATGAGLYSLKTLVLTGAAASQAGAAAPAGTSGSGTAMSSAITPTQLNSWAFASTVSNAASGTAVGVTDDHNVHDGTDGVLTTAGHAVTSALSAETLGWTAAASAFWAWAALEILAAATPVTTPVINTRQRLRQRRYPHRPARTRPQAVIWFDQTGGGGTAAIDLEEVAAAADAISPAAAIDLEEVAGATEAIAVTVAVPLADDGAAADADQVGIPTGDSGAAAEALAVAASVSLADSGAGADANQVGIPTSDEGGAADAIAIASAIPLADAGAAADANAVGIPDGDAAAGADSLQVSATVGLAESGGGTDADIVGIPTGDTAAGAEALAVAAAVGLAESGGGADSDRVGIPTSDTAGGAEQFTTAAQVPLADAAGAADSVFQGQPIPEGDTAGGAEAIAVTVAAALPDTAGAVEAISVSAGLQISFADAGAAAEAVQPAASAALADDGGSADQLTASAAAAFSDVSGAAEAIAVVQAAPGQIQNIFVLHAAPPQWRALPGGSWQATCIAAGWNAAANEAQWAVRPVPPAWEAVMAEFDPIAAVSIENINVTWTTRLAGTQVDPTGQTAGQPELTVQFAFPASSGNPLRPAEPVTWFTGAWLDGTTSAGYVAQVLVGPAPGVVLLTAGQSYDVWSKITASPEVPAKFAGTLTVY